MQIIRGKLCHVRLWYAMAAMMLLSCITDNSSICPHDGTKEDQVTLNFTLYTGNLSTRVGDTEEDGLDDENYINTEDLSIVVLDNKGKYLQEAKPDLLRTTDNGVFVRVVMTREAEVTIKVLVLANWSAVDGGEHLSKVTLDNIPSFDGLYKDGENFNFSYSPTNGTSWKPEKSNKKGIPMVGLSSEVTVPEPSSIFVPELDLGTINMLRALAKIEIVNQTPAEANAVLEKATLKGGYMSSGRFIPDGSASPDWCGTAQVRTPSLPSDATKENKDLIFVSYKKMVDIKNTDNTTKKEERTTLAAYIPEMDLSGLKVADANRSQIAVNVEGIDNPFTIEFSKYGDDGRPKADASGEYEFYGALLRNHIYRYNIISIGVETELLVTTDDWNVDEEQKWDFEDAVTEPESFRWEDKEGTEFDNWDTSDINDDQKRILLIGNNDDDAAYGRFTLPVKENNPAKWTISLIPDDETKNDHFKIEVLINGEWKIFSEEPVLYDYYTADVSADEVVFRIIATEENSGSLTYTARVVMTVTTFDGRVSTLQLTKEPDPTKEEYYYRVKQVSNGGDNM